MNHESATSGSRQSTVSVVIRLQVVKSNKFLLFSARVFILPEAGKYDIEPTKPTIQWEPRIKGPRFETEN